MRFILAKEENLPGIMHVVGEAQTTMEEMGIDQWQNGYPSEEVFLKDIAEGNAYIVWGHEHVIAVVSVFFNNEPTYKNVHNGQWLTDGEYVTIHRLAVEKRYRRLGISRYIFKEVETMAVKMNIPSFRIDTDEGNLPMRQYLKKHKFKECGTIRLINGDERIAYEKIFK